MSISFSNRHFIVLLFIFSVVLVSAHAESDGFADLPQAIDGVAAPAPVSAQELLQDCRARMPAETVRLTGWVRNRRPRGVVDREFDFEAELRWGAAVPVIQYTFSTAREGILARATFRHAADISELILQTGANLEPAETPAWNASILGTDIAWLDLSMDFLHWTKAELNGEAKVRGRLCDLVELYPPVEIPGCKKVRLWVDREIRMFLQAQEIDEDGKIQRQMWVKSVKKMNDRWMVQDIEVEARGSNHRTRLHVLSCE